MSACPQCSQEAEALRPDARGKPVCHDCCVHDYSWGTCKFCGRTWGLRVSVRPPPKKEEPPPW